MPNIRHAITINAAPTRILPLISSAEGFKQWWAADATQDPSTGIVDLSFSEGDTVYRFEPLQGIPSGQLAWLCKSGSQWDGTKLEFEWAFDQTSTLLKFTHSGWPSETDNFIFYNTIWGALMFRLKEAAEGKGPGPLFATFGLE